MNDNRTLEQTRDHLWLHYTNHSNLSAGGDVPVITRAEGNYFWDDQGRRYLDGLSGLFATNLGHGRPELAEAAAQQIRELDYFPIWGSTHPRAAELAEALADKAPGDLNRVFFTNSGSESVETAWKLIKQYFKAIGQPTRHKVISRALSYHGTTHGALSITSLPPLRAPFEPLVPGARKVPNTDAYRAPEHLRGDDEAFGIWAADRIAEAIEFEGPETIAAVFLEPVQNSGAAIPPPAGYFKRVREIADKYGVMLVADEVITAMGRIGDFFAINRYGITPDIITGAKGITAGYIPAGAVIASDRIFEPFTQAQNTFTHGLTFGGHPVAAAVGLETLRVFEREKLNEHVRDNEHAFRDQLAKLTDLPIVGDVRGAGYFWGVVLVKDKATRAPFTPEDRQRLFAHLAPALRNSGLHARLDDRGDPAVLLAPPTTAGPTEFAFIEQVLRTALSDAWARL
ncbi:aspartate aminotransferase family protein [Auritidibacter sp. NML100628]|uniref:aspartate aminotransferase family protein n=1 Tax=Auritidibacter sp. NML100628 TaxID=2170742 RepID=UPI000D73D85B|nr:aspartate aminotransferase family protein [Auritidibacter sp. NML100628]PXA77075.1 aspartate aminotransferase family protein [Auritidibacter sp. NML100628]